MQEDDEALKGLLEGSGVVMTDDSAPRCCDVERTEGVQ